MDIEPAHIFLSDKYSKKQINHQEFVKNMFALARFDYVDPQMIYDAMRALSFDELNDLWQVLSAHNKFERIPMLMLLSLGVMPKDDVMLSNAIWSIKTISPEHLIKLEGVCGQLERRELLDKLSNCVPSAVHTSGENCYFTPLARSVHMNGVGFKNTLLPSFINLKETSLNLSRRSSKSTLCEGAEFNRLLYGSTIIYRMLHPEMAQSNRSVFSLVDVDKPVAGQVVYLSNNHNTSGFDRLLTFFLDELSKMGCAPKQPLGTERYAGFYELDCDSSVLLSLLNNSDWRWIKSTFHNALSAHDPYGLFELISAAIFAAQNGEAVDRRVLDDAKLTWAQWD